MQRQWSIAAALPLVLFLSTVAPGEPNHPQSSSRSSKLSMTPDSRVFVINPDSSSVSIVDPLTREVEEFAVGGEPGTIIVEPSGLRAWVTLRNRDALLGIKLVGQGPDAVLPTGPEPFGVVADSKARLYVSVGGGDRVDVFDSEGLRRITSIETEAQPRGLAISSDETTLYVTHFLTGRLTQIDTETLAVTRVISTGADSNLSQSILLDEARGLAWLPLTRSNSTNQALLFDTTLFPIVAAVDLVTGANDNKKRIALDIADRPVNMPSDAVMGSNGILWVVHSGSNDVSAIDLESGFAVAHIEVGDRPQSIALSPDGSQAYVNNTLSGTLTVIDTSLYEVVDTIRVTTLPLPPDILRGKILFHSSNDPRLAKDQWISCAACHPDGRTDGRTWFFRDGPRNTPPLVGSRDTSPWHWSGDLDELEDVEDTIRVVQAGTGLADGSSNCRPACDQAPPNSGRSSDLDALGTFLRSIRSMGRSPDLREGGSLTPESSRGGRIFFSEMTACSSCHIPPHFTDRMKHDVGTGRESSHERKGTSFDTPSLRFLFATPPYLHDGSAITLLDVLTSQNPNDLHGRTSHLSEEELEDLIIFLKSIPHETKRRRGVERPD